MRVWLAQIATARKPQAEVNAYARLQRLLLQEYKVRDVLPYDDAAAAACASLKRQRIRIGMDLRIGAIALTHDARVISRNLRDFREIPHLRVEDWTRLNSGDRDRIPEAQKSGVCPQNSRQTRNVRCFENGRDSHLWDADSRSLGETILHSDYEVAESSTVPEF
jgi:hypothetical protein